MIKNTRQITKKLLNDIYEKGTSSKEVGSIYVLNKDGLSRYVINTKSIYIKGIEIQIHVLKEGTKIPYFITEFAIGMALFDYDKNERIFHVYLHEELFLKTENLTKAENIIHDRLCRTVLIHEIGHLMTLTNNGEDSIKDLQNDADKLLSNVFSYLKRNYTNTFLVKLYKLYSKFANNYYTAKIASQLQIKILEDAANTFAISCFQDEIDRQVFLGYLDFLGDLRIKFKNSFRTAKMDKIAASLGLDKIDNYLYNRQLYNKAMFIKIK